MKKYLLIITTFLSLALQGQNKLNLVEHFTNSWCTICTSRNPGLFENINAQQDVLHIAYYPSSPYPGCIINQQNKPENDARTQFYGIYGATPRIVINGVVQPTSANYANSAIFNPFKNLSADIAVTVTQQTVNDSIKSIVTIKRLTNKNYAALKLHVLYVEDTLFYNSPNGENKHYNVFRKSANGITGTDIVLPATANDSITIETATQTNVAWNQSRIYTLVFVQNASDKTILNVAKSNTEKSGSTSIKALQDIGVELFPNPATDMLHISLSHIGPHKISITNMLGTEMLHTIISNSAKLDLTGFNKGIYFVSIENTSGKSTQKVLIK